MVEWPAAVCRGKAHHHPNSSPMAAAPLLSCRAPGGTFYAYLRPVPVRQRFTPRSWRVGSTHAMVRTQAGLEGRFACVRIQRRGLPHPVVVVVAAAVPIPPPTRGTPTLSFASARSTPHNADGERKEGNGAVPTPEERKFVFFFVFDSCYVL